MSLAIPARIVLLEPSPSAERTLVAADLRRTVCDALDRAGQEWSYLFDRKVS